MIRNSKDYADTLKSSLQNIAKKIGLDVERGLRDNDYIKDDTAIALKQAFAQLKKCDVSYNGWYSTSWEERIDRLASPNHILTAAEKAAKVTVIKIGGTWYKDFSAPIDAALAKVIRQAKNLKPYPRFLPAAGLADATQTLIWFYYQVDNGRPWDIKLKNPWNGTIAENTFPGENVKVCYKGYLFTPEALGNYTYGYIGNALKLPLNLLYTGSWVVAKFPVLGARVKNEYRDRLCITKGFADYEK